MTLLVRCANHPKTYCMGDPYETPCLRMVDF